MAASSAPSLLTATGKADTVRSGRSHSRRAMLGKARQEQPGPTYPSAAMLVELWPPDRCKPYLHNPRINDHWAVDAVAESIRRFGFRQPIVVDTDSVIVRRAP